MNKGSTFLVKLGDRYVASPSLMGPFPVDASDWTHVQQYAWRWMGLESGNGARCAARILGARVVRLVPRPTQARPK